MPDERQSPSEHLNSAEQVEVAYANDSIQAAMIQGLLENGGIPSVLQALGVNGPQLGFGTLATSPQRIMVNIGQAEEARALLAETEQDAWPEVANDGYLEDDAGSKPRSYGLVGAYARIYLWSFCALAVAFGVFVLLRAT